MGAGLGEHNSFRHMVVCALYVGISSGGDMGRPRKVSEEPTLLDLYAAMASIGVLQKYGPEALPAFVASKSFEIAAEMVQKRTEILGAKDE